MENIYVENGKNSFYVSIVGALVSLITPFVDWISHNEALTIQLTSGFIAAVAGIISIIYTRRAIKLKNYEIEREKLEIQLLKKELDEKKHK